MEIPFNVTHTVGHELDYIQQAIVNLHLSGDGYFTQKCQSWLEQEVGCVKALLTHSCTAALEMSAMLIDTAEGDEIIMPSFTFVSTATAFALRGGVPVFVDIKPDTLNLDETKVEAAITSKTKAIVPVHYAGVGCEMKALMEIAQRHNLYLIEDAAQAIMSKYDNRSLGGIGHLGTLSFHQTKNVICGEGGALLINDSRLVKRAEIIREKGTNRNQFFRGQVDKYTWVDIGSSYLPGEINAAFLWAQLKEAERIIEKRRIVWNLYHEAFIELEEKGIIRRPFIPPDCKHNGHIYYILVEDLEMRQKILNKLKACGINAIFHYVPLHSSPAGKKYGRAHGNLINTDTLSDRLIRLPLWVDMTSGHIMQVVDAVYCAFDLKCTDTVLDSIFFKGTIATNMLTETKLKNKEMLNG